MFRAQIRTLLPLKEINIAGFSAIAAHRLTTSLTLYLLLASLVLKVNFIQMTQSLNPSLAEQRSCWSPNTCGNPSCTWTQS